MATLVGTTDTEAFFTTFRPNNTYVVYNGPRDIDGRFATGLRMIVSSGEFTFNGITYTTGFKILFLTPSTQYNNLSMYSGDSTILYGALGNITTAAPSITTSLIPLASRSDTTLAYNLSSSSTPSSITGLLVYSKDSLGTYQSVTGPIGSYNSTTKVYTISGLAPYIAYKVIFGAPGFQSKTLLDQYTKTVSDFITVTTTSSLAEKVATAVNTRTIIKTIIDNTSKLAQQLSFITSMRSAFNVTVTQTATYSVTDATQKQSLLNTLNNGATTSLVKSEIVGVLPSFTGTTATVDIASYDTSKSYLFEVPIGYVLILKNGATTLALTFTGTSFTGTGGPYGIGSIINVGGKVFKLWGFGSAGVNPLSIDTTVATVVVDGQTATIASGTTFNQIRTTAFKTDMTTTVTTTHPNATVVVTKPAQFVAEDNTVTFTVTAEDGITKQTYTVPVWVKPDYLPCFPAGTRVMVPGGYTAVEDLKVSDLIVTSDGRQVSFKRYKTHIAKANKDTAPYLVKAGAFGRAQPPNDVRLSGLHAIQSRKGVWQIPQYAALSNDSVVQYGLGEPVTYYHIELPNFFTDNLIVEGAVCESYAGQQADHVKTVYNYNGNLNGFTRVSGKPYIKSASK